MAAGHWQRQSGLTIVELMVSMTLGLLVTAIGAGLLASGKTSYLFQDESIELQENGRFALEIIARSVRQAGFQSWNEGETPLTAEAYASPDIVGMDARSLKSNTVALESVENNAVNGSDVLALRFFGAGTGESGDGSILNCAGLGVGASASSESEINRGWSIFYVATDATGEPELRCKYKGKTAWTSDAIVRGVESFQVLYGIDLDADGLADRFLSANQVDALDDALTLVGENAPTRNQNRQARSHWKKVVAVRVAMLLRGASELGAEIVERKHALFGSAYCDRSHTADKGSCLGEKDFQPKVRNRLRKIFETTISIRNRYALPNT
ncbi:MAG: PilW family protein [Proteobacteria bacterium]|nr:PilW family protein [Pseudomonadota bacterium]